MALMLSAFWMMGMKPGPELLTKNLHLVYLIIWTIALSNILGAALCFLFTDHVAKLATVRIEILAPIVIMLIYGGGLVTTMNIGDIIVVVIFCILGWGMKQLDWPRPPLLLGFILGTVNRAVLFRFDHGLRLQMGGPSRRAGHLCADSHLPLGRSPDSAQGGRGAVNGWRRVMKAKISKKLIPHMGVIVVIGIGFLLTRSWPYETALFPRVGCIVVLIVAIISLIGEVIRGGQRQTTRTRGCRVSSPGGPSLRRAALVFGWLVFFLIGVWALGYEFAAVAFVFLFMKITGKQSWRISILFTMFSFGFLYSVFRLLLDVIWPHGALWEMLGL